MENSIKKKDVLYYTRIIPNCGIYDVFEVKVRSVYDDYFVALEKEINMLSCFTTMT